jgi:hypothetical protein
MIEVEIPIDKNTDCCNTNIGTNNEVSENNPSTKERIIAELDLIYLDLGGFCIMLSSGGLNPSAVAGGPSVTRLTYVKLNIPKVVELK